MNIQFTALMSKIKAKLSWPCLKNIHIAILATTCLCQDRTGRSGTHHHHQWWTHVQYMCIIFMIEVQVSNFAQVFQSSQNPTNRSSTGGRMSSILIASAAAALLIYNIDCSDCTVHCSIIHIAQSRAMH